MYKVLQDYLIDLIMSGDGPEANLIDSVGLMPNGVYVSRAETDDGELERYIRSITNQSELSHVFGNIEVVGDDDDVNITFEDISTKLLANTIRTGISYYDIDSLEELVKACHEEICSIAVMLWQAQPVDVYSGTDWEVKMHNALLQELGKLLIEIGFNADDMIKDLQWS